MIAFAKLSIHDQTVVHGNFIEENEVVVEIIEMVLEDFYHPVYGYPLEKGPVAEKKYNLLNLMN